ncbi:MAG: phenylacetate-CoA oxygenase subunit PaaI [Alicyclobacillaceae bacterium]|nr:phenylacetate-CoA oxygenase subunit PaaI [Alicyclobacillaceae bacterium]
MGFNPAVERFLIEWALDEFVVGHLLGVQTFHYGPDLEENIAVGSISQDELGHARMMLRLLAEDEKELDRVVYTKPPEEMKVATLAQAWKETDWSYLVVKSMLYDVADQVRFDFFVRLPDEKLRTIEGMMGREENVHREHWQEWVDILSSDAEGRRRLQEALDELYPYLADFFATDVYEEVAKAYGMAATDKSSLLGRCLQQVKERFRPYQYTMPLADEQMVRLLEEPKGRAGRHLEVFKEIYADIHSVYDQHPEMVWG